jgi:hypothetical protein
MLLREIIRRLSANLEQYKSIEDSKHENEDKFYELTCSCSGLIYSKWYRGSWKRYSQKKKDPSRQTWKSPEDLVKAYNVEPWAYLLK